MFLLEPAAAAASTGTPKAESVRVGIVNVAAPYRGKTFIYRESDLRYESDYYDEFFIAPAIMLSTPLICASIGAATESASVFESAPG